MASFLHVFKSIGGAVGKGAEKAVETVGADAVGAIAQKVGGPVAGSVATALAASVIRAEQKHVDAGGPSMKVDSLGPVGMDSRKRAVLDDFKVFMPVIESLASASGHPIENRAEFEAALPAAIDSTVAAFNAFAGVMKSFKTPAEPPPLPASAAAPTEAAK